MAINKEILKQCIRDKQDEIDATDIIERPFDFEDNGNYVFVGVRHVGKSYMMYQRIKQLQQKGMDWSRMLFINFEDERLVELDANDLNILLEAHYEMYGTEHKPIMFFDEIQNVPHWDKFVRRLADAKYRIYVTGSNAKMLSKDVATTLGGRFFIVDIYPYSFREYLNANKLVLSAGWQHSTREKSKVLALFNEYFYYGGLPEIVLYKSKRAMLSSLYQKIYLGDICKRNDIRNDKALNIMVKKLAESVKQPSSYNRIQNVVKSTGNKVTVSTISEYIGHVIDSWLIIPIGNDLGKLAEKESVKKYYFIDNGILNLFLLNSETSLLENLVAVSLCRKYGKENVKYIKSTREIDFYLDEQQIAIQVSYSITDRETYKRETDALMKFSAAHKGVRLFIITKEENKVIACENATIEVVSICRWLLSYI